MIRHTICAALFLLCSGCVPMFIYKPAVVEGIVVNAETGMPIAGAEVTFTTHPGIIAETSDDGGFSIGDRDFAILPLLPDVGMPFMVTLRVAAEGYESLSLELLSGKHVLDEPLRMQRKR